jgi:hypothetical protein
VFFVAELSASGFAVELPVDFGASTMDSTIPGAGFTAQGLPMRDAPLTQAWPGKQADFDLRLVEPTSRSGRVMKGEPIPEPVPPSSR